jgi:hypothetical protein
LGATVVLGDGLRSAAIRPAGCPRAGVDHPGTDRSLIALALEKHMKRKHAADSNNAFAINSTITRAPSYLDLYKTRFTKKALAKSLKGTRVYSFD